jgi:hypothetical protein
MCITVMLPELAHAFGGIPAISNFLGQVESTVTGPVGGCLFATGVVKVGANCWRAGGIEGLSDGGLRTAAAGALIGGGPWIASQFGVSGAML